MRTHAQHYSCCSSCEDKHVYERLKYHELKIKKVNIQIVAGVYRRLENDRADTEPPPAKKQLLPPPFIVGEGLPVVPSKLVAKINRGKFADMAELLRDNIEAGRRRPATAGTVVAAILATKNQGVKCPTSSLDSVLRYVCLCPRRVLPETKTRSMGVPDFHHERSVQM